MKKIFFLLLWLTCSYNFAQTKIENLLSRGKELAYSFQLAEAEKIFEKVIETAPEQLYGYYYLSQIHLWKFLGSKNPEAYFIFLQYSDLALKYAEKMEDENPENAFIKYYLGNIHFSRTLAQAFNNSTLDAFWSSKSANSYFNETLELNPEFYDAYVGIGFLKYSLSYVPSVFQWAVNIVGLQADAYEGLNDIKLAYKKGKYSKTEAAFHLSRIYLDYLAEYDSSAVYINNLLEKYPQNILFLYHKAILQLKSKRLNEADQILNKIVKINDKDFSQISSLSFLLLGDVRFYKNKYTDAIKYYIKFIESSNDADYTGLGNLRLAICYYVQGSEDTLVQKHLELAREGNPDIIDDSYARLRSSFFLENGITPKDIRLISAANNIKAGSYRRAYDSLLTSTDSLESNDHKGLRYMLLSEAAFELKKYDECIGFADESLAIEEYTIEKWIIPYANYYKARAYYRLGDIDKSHSFLEAAEEQNDYDFKDILRSYINRLKRKLVEH